MANRSARGGFYSFRSLGDVRQPGEFDESGNYKLIYSLDEWGAMVGEHTVKITTQGDFGGGERIPPNYNVDSELSAVVKGGSNTFDFELTGELRQKTQELTASDNA
jgi:hypothetical protein